MDKTNKRKQASRRKLMLLAGVVAAVSIVIFYMLHTSKAVAPSGLSTTPGTPAASTVSPAGGLRPNPLGFAPYVYVPHGGVTMPDYGTATSASHFFAAFILGSGCTPLWDGDAALGLNSTRSKEVQAQIQTVRDTDGDVALSFGGQNGTELANSCTDTAQLQAAYQSVIDRFKAHEVNFDLEGANETDAAAMARRVQAVVALQQANSSLKVSLTVPVAPAGLGADALNTVKKFRDAKVTLSNVHIMAMNFGRSSSSSSESANVIAATKATVIQLKELYPDMSSTQIYQALGVVVMAGLNDVANEVFTLADAQAVRAFTTQNGVGTTSLWSANRDVRCDTRDVLSSRCSGIVQTEFEFGRILAGKN